MKKASKCISYHNAIATQYESMYQGPYWQLYRDITWCDLKKYLPKKNSVILDAGGGTGFWARRLATLGYRVVCADLAEGMLEEGQRLAKKAGVDDRIEFIRLDICKMKKLPDGSFDMVVALGDPVSYCVDPQRAMGELARVAKPGSPVVISVDGFYYRMERFLAKKRFKEMRTLEKTGIVKWKAHSQYNFTVDELMRLFSKSGLDVVEVIGKNVFLNTLSFAEVECLLSDSRYYGKVLNLEMRYNSDPSLVGTSCHLQVTGRKNG